MFFFVYWTRYYQSYLGVVPIAFCIVTQNMIYWFEHISNLDLAPICNCICTGKSHQQYFSSMYGMTINLVICLSGELLSNVSEFKSNQYQKPAFQFQIITVLQTGLDRIIWKMLKIVFYRGLPVFQSLRHTPNYQRFFLVLTFGHTAHVKLNLISTRFLPFVQKLSINEEARKKWTFFLPSSQKTKVRFIVCFTKHRNFQKTSCPTSLFHQRCRSYGLDLRYSSSLIA